VIDPVSEELAEREHLVWPWKTSLAVALALHLGIAAALLLGGGRHSRPLVLPRVQVRIGALPMPARGSRAAGPAAAARAAQAAAPTAVAAPPKHPLPAAKPTARPVSPRPVATPIPGPIAATGPVVSQGEPSTGGHPLQGGGGSGAPSLTHAGSGLGVGVGGEGNGGATDESFPYAYYLNRLLGAIESNWFKPPVPAGTRCRVRTRLDRSGRLLEAGIEEESGNPAFDRAALRAVYASTPLPPLPEGFQGATLTLHLEFGP